VRIATWNINSVKARLPFVLHWLDAREPDIACFQELKVDDDNFPIAAFEERGYQVALHAQPTWNGVAVISKQPAVVRQAGLEAAEDAGARLLTVDVGDLSITSVYVPNGKTLAHEDFQMKLHWMAKLNRYARSLIDPSKKMLIGGDFNIVPYDVDSHLSGDTSGRIFHTEQERSSLIALFDSGLVDMYRAHNPDGAMFSWWDYRAGSFHKNQGLRIDLLLATPPLVALAKDVWIDRDYRKKKDGHTPSDHAPVIADLEA
jgi:exodeoxyribonuclease-3